MAADRDVATSVPPIPRARPAGAGDQGAPYRICMVCLGNICRSPMAEVILADELDRAGLGGQVTVESAGTGDWHIGGPMDSRSRAELARRGYDGSRHVARQIRADWLARYDLFVVMDGKNLASLRRMAAGEPELAERIVLLRAFDPAAGAEAEVPDPYDGGPAEYVETFDLVHAAARGLTSRLAEVLTGSNAPVGDAPSGRPEGGPR